jgi:hypothetical protein
MSDFKSRLEIEKSELDEKRSKLEAFINGENFNSIDPSQQELLKQQLPVMGEYSDILAERLALLN